MMTFEEHLAARATDLAKLAASADAGAVVVDLDGVGRVVDAPIAVDMRRAAGIAYGPARAELGADLTEDERRGGVRVLVVSREHRAFAFGFLARVVA